MRFYGPMGFARRRCVVCSARCVLLSPSLSFSPSIAHPSLHVCLVCVAHRNTYTCTHTHRGKVPTESREESKRRPCPLQTSSSSFSSCFSPDSSRLRSLSRSLCLSFSAFLSFFLRPGPRLDPLTGAQEQMKEEEKKKREIMKEKERDGREGRRKKNGTSAESTKSGEVLPSEAPYETDN